ncbi:MAG: hypothetical protein ABSD98_13915 [Candidatus Korobacteraceae bacterium]|jgi:hypothetical protein
MKTPYSAHSRPIVALAIVLTGTAALGQVLGYTCGKKGDNVPNRCNFMVEDKVKSGISNCRLDKSDPKVGWYTDCAGGAEQKVEVIGGTRACCAADMTCQPQKPAPLYVAACVNTASRTAVNTGKTEPTREQANPKMEPSDGQKPQ